MVDSYVGFWFHCSPNPFSIPFPVGGMAATFAYRGGSRLIREDRFVKSRHMAENCSDMKFLAMLPPMCGFVLTVHWLHSRQI